MDVLGTSTGFGYIGCLSFGGNTGCISVWYREILIAGYTGKELGDLARNESRLWMRWE